MAGALLPELQLGKPAQEESMTQFTQLNLGSNSGKKTGSSVAPATRPYSCSKKPTVAMVGTLMVTALAGVFLLETSACSKSKPVAISQPEQPSVNQQAALPAVPTPAVAPEKPVKKSPRQSTAASYKNAEYGISLVYPKGYNLKKDEEANLEWTGSGPVQMNFVQPGGGTLAAIEMPKNSYPDTDFASGFFNVSVHPKMSADECAQFAFPETTGNAAATPAKVKMGSSEFSEIEASAGDASNQADAKYYHLFQNDACYEFALGIQTARDAGNDVPQVDRQRVFNKLKRILTTVKIKSVGEPAAASAPAVPENPTMSQK
jgi:hypothetical protein